jgi:hypothetical protein
MSKDAPPSQPRVRQRWSHTPRQHLTVEQLENNWAALGHAERLGLRPNASLDIHFDRGRLDDPTRNAGAALKAFLKSARQWVERRGCETAIIWTMENRSGFGGEGVHAHVLMHVPIELLTRWHQLRRRWARKAGLEASKSRVINFNHVRSLDAAKGKLAYMSKDAHPDTLAIFEPFLNTNTGKPWLHDANKPSNAPIYGLKTGVSRNINAKARTSYRHPVAEPL